MSFDVSYLTFHGHIGLPRCARRGGLRAADEHLQTTLEMWSTQRFLATSPVSVNISKKVSDVKNRALMKSTTTFL